MANKNMSYCSVLKTGFNANLHQYENSKTNCYLCQQSFFDQSSTTLKWEKKQIFSDLQTYSQNSSTGVVVLLLLPRWCVLLKLARSICKQLHLILHCICHTCNIHSHLLGLSTFLAFVIHFLYEKELRGKV